MSTPFADAASIEAPPSARIEGDRADGRLRNMLRLNAGFSTVTGVAAAVAAGPVADLIGVDQVWLIRSIGVGLLGFAAALLLVARAQVSTLSQWARLISFADFGWVVGTGGVIAAGWLSTTGAVVMGSIAVIVLDLGIGQLLARRRLG